MRTWRFSWLLGMTLASVSLSGCSSDALVPPEPEVATPGSFVAVIGYEAPGQFTLVRMIDRLDFEFETLLFYTIYDVNPSSWEEAREMARGPDLPLRQEIDAQPSGAITEIPHRVVWFRTLTPEEQGRVK
jgi:hypothetical protein